MMFLNVSAELILNQNIYKHKSLFHVKMEKRWWFLLLLIPLLYRPVLGLFFIFLFPGVGYVLLFFKKTKLHEMIALSIVLSLCLVVLNGFFLNTFFGLNFFSVFVSLALIILIPLSIYIQKIDFHIYDFKFKKPTRKQMLSFVLLILCLMFLGIKVYKPHINNPYPIHLDEWSRLLETTHIIDEHTFNNRYNPQFVGHPDAPRRLNPGFQFILSQFYIISGVDEITFFQYLPMLFAILTGFILFSFLLRISNYWTGIFSIMLLSFLKTNDNTLGISFLVALTMTFPLLYGLFYYLYNFFKKKNVWYLFFSSIIYFSILVIHEQTGAAFLPIILIYLIINSIAYVSRNGFDFKIKTKSVLVLLISLIVPLFSLYVARSWLWKGSLNKTWNFLIDLIVWKGITQVRFPYNFPLFYGIILSLLAIFGIILFYKKVDMNVFVIWSIIAVGQVINFFYNHVTYFSYIERVRHHAVLGLIPLSAFGLYVLIHYASDLIKMHKRDIFLILSLSAIIFGFIISLTYVDKGEYLPYDMIPKNGLVLNPVLDIKDYKAILFIKSISSGNVVLADPIVSASIYPISKNYIVASSQNPDDGFGGGNTKGVKRFFSSSSCLTKQTEAYQNNVRYVLSSKPIDCVSFRQVYSKDFRYVYEVQ